jgi:hypothetical protein
MLTKGKLTTAASGRYGYAYVPERGYYRHR